MSGAVRLQLKLQLLQLHQGLLGQLLACTAGAAPQLPGLLQALCLGQELLGGLQLCTCSRRHSSQLVSSSPCNAYHDLSCTYNPALAP